MAAGHGGRRTRAGRRPDPHSSRSVQRRGSALELPPAGYTGPIPAWPLAGASERELEVWTELWRTPQAAVWAVESWRHRTVGMYCRWSVRMEAEDATAAIGAVATRLADQLGLTPSGLTDQGWIIGPAESALPARRRPPLTLAPDPPAEPPAPRRRRKDPREALTAE